MFIGLMAAVGVALLVLERIMPARPQPAVERWYRRVLAFNVLCVLLAVTSGIVFEPWLRAHALFHLGTGNALVDGVLGFLAYSFPFYWWHRARHQVDFFWRWFHQVHHSPARIETLTTFYQHPFDFGATVLSSSTLLYFLFGFSPTAVGFFGLMATGIDYLGHTNIRSPYWLGYVIQRPEMHRIHHERGAHNRNYGLPIWDRLFGTYENPRARDVACGFEDDREQQVTKMLVGGDVFR